MTEKESLEQFGIVTFKDHWVDLSTGPKPEQVNIEDIAHHLSLQCRYAGACNRFYSIAEHCLYVSLLSPNKMFAAYYLLHDSHETWYQDLTAPMKRLIRAKSPVYDNLLKQCDKIVIPAIGLNYNKYLNLEKDIKDVDNFVYDLERKRLFGRPQPLGVPSNHPLYKAPFGMSAEEAEAEFLQAFNLIMT